jgi:dihydropyrimidinase
MAAEYDLLIVDGIVVTDTEIQEWDIAIKDEKIAKILPRGSFKSSQATRTIDAEGGYVMPGGVRFTS